jgi:Tfp pilus assembly protein PilF
MFLCPAAETSHFTPQKEKQRMYPWQNKALLTGCALVLILPLEGARGQAWTSDCSKVVVHVRDSSGLGIANAMVTVNQAWTYTTDFDGAATLECRPDMNSGALVEVTAHGFKPQSRVLHQLKFGDANIYLDRAISESRVSSATVSVKELRPDVQARSEELQEKAVKALQNGEDMAAEELLKEAFELTPSSGSICNNLGVAYLQRNEYGEAAAWFEKAAAAAPYNPLILGNLGLIRWYQNRQDESYMLLDRAVTGGYSSPFGHYLLGVMFLQKDEYKKSIEQMRKTDRERFPYRDLYISLAQRMKGDQKAAVRSYRTFVENHTASLQTALIPSNLDLR